MRKRDLLGRPVRPFEPEGGDSASRILAKLAETSFQGRALGEAFKAWRAALDDEVVIWLGLAGAMVPAGMRRVVAYLIRERLVDCVVSTGANLFHDAHESLGRYHFRGSPSADDTELRERHIDRIYDTFADEDQFMELDGLIGSFGASLEPRPYTTREFLALLGGHLAEIGSSEGILTTAAASGVPVYCSAIGDSSIGIGLAGGKYTDDDHFLFDVVADVRETARIVLESPGSAVIYVGGGHPKNFIQQTEVTASVIVAGEREIEGHRYAVQFVTDSPHWGGLSGCTFEEAQSWGKISRQARMVTCHVDATIGLPLVVSALADVRTEIARPYVPKFDLGPRLAIS
jgi:deoxyhypusine synthase